MKSNIFEEVRERLEKLDAADAQYLKDIQEAEEAYHEAIRAAKKKHETAVGEFL